MTNDHRRDAEIVERLRALCRMRGAQTQFARAHGFSSAFISLVISGKANPSRRLTEIVIQEATAMEDYDKIAQECYYG